MAAALLVGIAAGCGDEAGDTVSDEPPWCLADIALPDDADAIGAALAAMPDEHNGARGELMTSTERIELSYDEPLEGMPSIQALSVDALERAFPEAAELTGFEVMETMLEAGLEPVDPGGVTGELDQISMDPKADLVWATGDTVELGETTADDIRAPSVTFASPDGRWIFTIMASNDDLRVELVEEFCDAVDR